MPSFNGIVWFLTSSFLSDIYIFNIYYIWYIFNIIYYIRYIQHYVLSIYRILALISKIFSHFCRLLFCFIDSILCLIQALQFHEVPFINFHLSAYAIGSNLFRESSAVPRCSRLFATFSSIRFSIYDFEIQVFCRVITMGLFSVFYIQTSILPAPYVAVSFSEYNCVNLCLSL